MTLKQLKQELLNKPSYFKESALTIASRFKVDTHIVRRALGELQAEKKAYNTKVTQTLDNQKLSDAVDFYKNNKSLMPLDEIHKWDAHPVISHDKKSIASPYIYEGKEIKDTLKQQEIAKLAKGLGVTEQTLNSLLLKNAQEESDSTPSPFLSGDPKNTLIIGDTHLPFEKPGYLEFCREVQEKYNCGSVVHIGDLVDNHAVSYHESDVEGRSAGDEYKLALEKCHNWYKVFPEVKICIGNHDALPFRKAFTAGLPSAWLKSYQQILDSPEGWKLDFVHQINGIIYQHGTGMSGEMAAVNAARENRQSTIIGHLHTVSNIKYMASYKDLIFGMTVGCGIDFEAYAFAYGRQQTRKPVVSCGVVLDGRVPIIIPMDLD